MRMRCSKVIAGIICLSLLLLFPRTATLFAAVPPEVPVKGMVTMIDLGAGQCIPCKMMAPILEKLKKEYAGRAAVIFLDVREDQTPARRFGIRTIPTQIFFDKEGREVFRHAGVLLEDEIVRRFNDLGVK